jgi:folate/biopterin transporter
MLQNDMHGKDPNAESKMELKKRRNKFAYLIISFNQGIGSISELAVSYLFKDELKVEPARMTQLMSFIAIPWMIKPLFGMLTDLCPIFGYRRKYYIILCGLLCILSWLLLATQATGLGEVTALLFIINMALSFSTVLGEAIVVELSQLHKDSNDNSAKDYVSLFFFCKYFGALLSSYLKGLFVDIMSVRHVFLVSSVLPWLLVISGFVLMETKQTSEQPNSNSQSQAETYGAIDQEHSRISIEQAPKAGDLVSEFFKFLFQKHVLIPTIFIIIFVATPSYGDPFFYFLTNELKFTPSSLGKISFCTTLCTLFAILMYKMYFKDVDFKKIIVFGTIISFVFSFMGYLLVMRVNVSLGISDFWFVLFSNSFLAMLGELIMMPMLSLAAQLCPKNLEGTVYALFMSALNFGGIVSGLLGSVLTGSLGITSKDYHNLNILILISNVVGLMPLPMLLCISSSYFNPNLKKENEDNNKLLSEENCNKELDLEKTNYNTPDSKTLDKVQKE